MSDSSIPDGRDAARLLWETIVTQRSYMEFDGEVLPPLRGRQASGDAEARARHEAQARARDRGGRIPGTSIRVGADAALNLIPGVGTLAAKAVSGYLIWEARRLGVPSAMLLRMLGNLGIDAAISAVPVVGWFGDVFWRANARNIELLRDHLDGRVNFTQGRPT
jgi:hypothetical protein